MINITYSADLKQFSKSLVLVPMISQVYYHAQHFSFALACNSLAQGWLVTTRHASWRIGQQRSPPPLSVTGQPLSCSVCWWMSGKLSACYKLICQTVCHDQDCCPVGEKPDKAVHVTPLEISSSHTGVADSNFTRRSGGPNPSVEHLDVE